VAGQEARPIQIKDLRRLVSNSGARPQQQVHPGLRQLRPDLDLRQQRTWEHQRLADPVGFLDDA
jgi:hypothetical protein